jgi:hypothetical protein
MVDGKREKEMSNTAVSIDDNNSTTTTTTADTPRYYLYSSKLFLKAELESFPCENLSFN